MKSCHLEGDLKDIKGAFNLLYGFFKKINFIKFQQGKISWRKIRIRKRKAQKKSKIRSAEKTGNRMRVTSNVLWYR